MASPIPPPSTDPSARGLGDLAKEMASELHTIDADSEANRTFLLACTTAQAESIVSSAIGANVESAATSFGPGVVKLPEQVTGSCVCLRVRIIHGCKVYAIENLCGMISTADPTDWDAVSARRPMCIDAASLDAADVAIRMFLSLLNKSEHYDESVYVGHIGPDLLGMPGAFVWKDLVQYFSSKMVLNDRVHALKASGLFAMVDGSAFLSSSN